MNDERARRGRLIVEVLTAEVARAGARGLVLASAPDAETDVLAAWLPAELPLRRPDPGAVSDVAGALAAAGAPGGLVETMAWQTVAAAQGLAEELLPVGTTNKTSLLLGDAPLPARVLPLGDVWASDVAEWVGRATLPPVLRGSGASEVAAVEASLQAYLVDGLGPGAAFAPLGDAADRIRAALDAGERHRRGLVVPKLEAWTVGIDLAR